MARLRSTQTKITMLVIGAVILWIAALVLALI